MQVLLLFGCRSDLSHCVTTVSSNTKLCVGLDAQAIFDNISAEQVHSPFITQSSIHAHCANDLHDVHLDIPNCGSQP